MKIKRQSLLIITAAFAVLLGLLTIVGSGKRWHLRTSGSESAGQIAVAETRTPSSTDQNSTAEAFERVMIRNIATVPFVESFDLLRSAPVEMRSRWMRQLDEMPSGPLRAAALSSFYKTFVHVDPHAAAQSVAGLHDKLSQSIAAGAMVGAAPPSAMEEMATMLIKLPADIPASNWGDVIYNWSAINPVAVAHFIEQHPEIPEYYSPISTLLSNWAQVDPGAAKEWLDRQSESIQTGDAITGLLDGWFEHDKTSALAFAVARGGEEKFERAINGLALSLFSNSPDEARAFVLRLPGEARNSAIGEIATLTNGRILGGSENWRRPPAEVARWILTLPQESWKGGMATVLENWDRQDAAGLSAWLDQFTPNTRDQLVAEFCSSGNHERPDRAIGLALTITDSALRAQTLDGYMCHWLSSSHKEAVSMIKGTALSEEQKKYLIGLLPDE